MVGGFDAKVRGNDRLGYHVRATVDYGGSPTTLHAYMLKEQGGFRLRALDAVPELGAEAFYAMTHGRKEQARQWLTWARERWQAGKNEDPLRLGAFIVLWDEGKGDARLAAAALAARGIAALWNLDRFDEHAAVISEAMKESNKKRDQWKPALARSYSGRGDFKRARAIREEIIADGKASAGNYNDNAWLGLFIGVTDKDVEHAMRAVQMRDGGDVSTLHTLAGVYADLGRLGEAQKTLEALLEQRKRGRPEPIDYYIIGRIAEGLGLRQAARAAYGRVEKPEDPYPTATYELVRRRLAKL